MPPSVSLGISFTHWGGHKLPAKRDGDEAEEDPGRAAVALAEELGGGEAEEVGKELGEVACCICSPADPRQQNQVHKRCPCLDS